MSAFVHTNDTYRSILPREDAHGKTWINAHAVASCTAHCPKAIQQGYDGTSRFGYNARALFDTGLASTTAATRQNQYYVGVVGNDTIASDSWGWFQIGGDCPTVYADPVTPGVETGTIGGFMVWIKDKIQNAGDGVSNSMACNAVGICTKSASASSYLGMYLLGRRLMGNT